MLYVFNLVVLKVTKDGYSVVFKWYCLSQTAVDKGFFILHQGQLISRRGLKNRSLDHKFVDCRMTPRFVTLNMR